MAYSARAAGNPEGIRYVDTDVSFFLVTPGGESDLERAAPGTVEGPLLFTKPPVPFEKLGKPVKDLTQERLKQLLHYDPATGLFTWRVGRRGPNARAGNTAGTRTAHGYWRIVVDGVEYFGHRLAWLYVHGRWPDGDIDHVNGIRDDNRLDNLRECSRSENLQNLHYAYGRSGLMGVSRVRGYQRWVANITVGGERHYLGCFTAPEEAHQAYLSAKARLHPFQTIAVKAA